MKKLSQLLILIFVVPSVGFATPCATSGMDVFRSKDEKSVILYVYSESSDIAFSLPGSEISSPDGTMGAKRFYIDGILFEIMSVKISEFVKSKKIPSDLEVLKLHATYEKNYIKESGGSPLTSYVEHGARVKPGSDYQPEFTFYLWQAVDPKNLANPSQYYLSTVLSGEVFYISAIVPKNKRGAAMASFEEFSSSLTKVMEKARCPKK